MFDAKFYRGAVLALDNAGLNGEQWLNAASSLADAQANAGDHDLDQLRSFLSPAGGQSLAYKQGIAEYFGARARGDAHDLALAKALQAAGLLPQAEDRNGIVNGVFNLAERAVQRVRNPRARQSNGRQF